MKKIIIVLVMCVTAVTGYAQTLLRTTVDEKTKLSKINVNVDNLPLNNATANMGQPGNKTPRNVVWIEYGDGQFTTSPESEHAFFDNEQSNCPFMIVKSTGIYDKGGKPPKQTAKPVPPAAKGKKPATGNLILFNEEESVRITPNVFDVAGGDTMMLALTYRRPKGSPDGTYRILFFYNMEGAEVFEPIKPDARYRVYDDEGKPVMLPYVRTHHGEQVIAPKELPGELYRDYKKDFKNSGYLVLNVNVKDDRERHLFLTLVPRKNVSVMANLSATMNFELVPPDNKRKRCAFGPRVLSQLASHDPNWHDVVPKCIVLPKKGQEMKHHVHFQNTGLGPARKVMVRTAIPTGLTAADIMVTGWSIGGVLNNPNFQLKVDRSRPDSVSFEFEYDTRNTRAVLAGAANLPDAPVNPSTMGDIYFKCFAKPGTPPIMLSGTAIYFDNNEAVKTEPANVEFKKCCDCDKEKDCDKYKSKFAKWLFCKDC
jgi:hypothetical protein